MAHKIAVSLLAGDRAMSVPDFFRGAKESGYDGVEMWLVPEGGLTFDVTDAQLDEYRKLAAEYGLKIYSVSIGPGGGNLSMPLSVTYGGQRTTGTAAVSSAGVVTFTPDT